MRHHEIGYIYCQQNNWDVCQISEIKYLISYNLGFKILWDAEKSQISTERFQENRRKGKKEGCCFDSEQSLEKQMMGSAAYKKGTTYLWWLTTEQTSASTYRQNKYLAHQQWKKYDKNRIHDHKNTQFFWHRIIILIYGHCVLRFQHVQMAKLVQLLRFFKTFKLRRFSQSDITLLRVDPVITVIQ